ncbi:uncharacterized protein AB675_10598 [Cyphellophora attinorum]|uniref:CENP-V/GFA domain-containing protein n=1 Tax=Cyphellophora attinorum TaxID=1664694 RepID=A0A0N1NZR1_9EURO|nr:uncharacterized protein AB675_10598 [Phialophora attinorum]KPI40725.1 hypothetical protein AB675_10598 [Phialophora attinorum]
MATKPTSPHTTTLQATCHCHTFSQTLTLPNTAFPLKSSICQCNTCRHVTAQLLSTFAVIPGPLPDACFFTHLAKYESTKGFERWFCPVCGASVLNVERRKGGTEVAEWEFATGVLEFPEQEKLGKGPLDGRLSRALMWVADTTDGGAVGWVNNGRGGEGLPGGRFMKGRDSETISDTTAMEMMVSNAKGLASSPKEDDVLRVHCHCRRVQLTIHAPSPAANPKDSSAEFCACTSCRKSSGFEITSWAHVAKDKVTTTDGRPHTEILTELAHYESSMGTHRYFCKTCGATIAYDRDDLKRLDLALGLMDDGKGSGRFDEWFTWNPDGEGVAYMEDARDRGFVSRLAEGVGRDTTRRDQGRR